MSALRIIIDMSLAASLAAAVVILARLVLKKAPRAYAYGLWAVVLFRLVCPVTIEGGFGIIPASISGWLNSYITAAAETEPAGVIEPAPPTAESTRDLSPIPVSFTLNQDGYQSPEPERVPEAPAVVEKALLSMAELITAIWLAGIAVMLCYGGFGWLKLRARVKTATLAQDGAYETDRIPAPFVLGFFRPRIYLPTSLDAGCRGYILEHERIHLRRGDFLVKPLAFLALAVHWFNPVVWLSFYLMCRDMEMSCDEAVLRRMGSDVRPGYSGALLAVSARQSGLRALQISPLAFGGGNTTGRVKNVLYYKKPKLWLSVMAIILSAVVAASCVTSLPTEIPAAPDTAATVEIPPAPERPDVNGEAKRLEEEVIRMEEEMKIRLAELATLLIEFENNTDYTELQKAEMEQLEELLSIRMEELLRISRRFEYNQAFIDDLKASITLEDDGLHFTVPVYGGDGNGLINLWISGRSETDDMGMSYHALTYESENKLWTAGESHWIPVTAEQAENYTGLTMNVYLEYINDRVYEYEIDLLEYYPKHKAVDSEPGALTVTAKPETGAWTVGDTSATVNLTSLGLSLPGTANHKATADLTIDMEDCVVEVVLSTDNSFVVKYNPMYYTVDRKQDGKALELTIRRVPGTNTNVSQGNNEKVMIYVPDIRFANINVNAQSSVMTLPALDADIYIKEQSSIIKAAISENSKRTFSLDSRSGISTITVSQDADYALEVHSRASILTFRTENKPGLPQYTMEDFDYADESESGAVIKLDLKSCILTLTDQEE